jgi:DNA topoisomerase-3
MGWKVLCHRAAQSEEGQKSLPQLLVGSGLNCSDASVESKKTTPPARYNEATLLAAMLGVHQQEKDPEIKRRLKESAGIGTPATRAGIIETLKKRGFIEEKRKSLISTPKGRDLIAALPDSLKSPGLTAIFEQLLDGIAGGHYSKQEFLGKQIEFVTQFIHDDCPIAPRKVQNVS